MEDSTSRDDRRESRRDIDTYRVHKSHRSERNHRSDHRSNHRGDRDNRDRERQQSKRDEGHGRHHHHRHQHQHRIHRKDERADESTAEENKTEQGEIALLGETVLVDEDGEWEIAVDSGPLEDSTPTLPTTSQEPQATSSDNSHTQLNKMRAQIMKAELKNDPNLAQLKKEYQDLVSGQAEGPILESVANKIHVLNPELEKLGKISQADDNSTIQQMAQDEIASRNRGDRLDVKLAEQIGKDAGYEQDEDYIAENAEKLSKISNKNEYNMRNQLMNKTKQMNDAIDNCSLCTENAHTPKATVISTATRVYLAVAPDPPIAPGVTCIIPMEHHVNTLECDDDEWEEIRNYMKSLTRMWASENKGVLFYENAVSHSYKQHSLIFAVPISIDLLKSAAGFFNEAMITSDDEWASHRKVINTLKKAESMDPSYAKFAFQTSIAKEAPYFHVWFHINGGMGHIIENTAKWPPGDQFAREVIGGMLQADPVLIRKRGTWATNDKGKSFLEKKWSPYEWTGAIQWE